MILVIVRLMHFCNAIATVFNYYKNNSDIFCHVEIPRDAHVLIEDDTSVTNKLTPTRLLNGKYESLGNIYYFKSGKLHSNNDFPARIDKTGNQFWYKDGELNRDCDKPAVISETGSQEWKSP
jgi:hypothetical protein